MCVAVPTVYRSACPGSSTDASRCVKTAMSLPFAIASSMSRTELSRATASGMKEFGKSTVSRSGRIGSSDGIASGRSPLVRSSGLKWSVVMAIRNPFYRNRNPDWVAGGEGSRAPPPAEPVSDAGILHVEEERRGAAALRVHPLPLLGDFARLFAVLAADGEGQGAQALLGDFLAAVEAVAVIALLEAAERVVDLVQRL